MSKTKNVDKVPYSQRQSRAYRILIIVLSVIIILTFILSLVK